MGKSRALRLIDQPASSEGSDVGEILVTSAYTGVIRIDQIPAPSGLVVDSQSVYRSTSAPKIAVTLSWRPAAQQRADVFVIHISESSSFTSIEAFQSVSNTATVLLKPGTTYYARVAGAYENQISEYSATLSFVTNTDTTVPPNVASMTLDWSKGDLYVTVPITNTDLVKDTRIRIYNTAQTILYDEVYTTAPYLFSAEENRRVTGNSPLTSLRVVADHRSWSNIISASGLGQNTTSPVPSGISGLTTTWNGDTGTASADLLITWNIGNQASSYGIEVNNSASQRFETTDTKFVYPYAVNQQNNPPSGLYTLPVRVWGINKISQSGVSSSVTHTNAAPSSAGASVSVLTGFSQAYGILTHGQIEDVREYEWRLIGVATGTTTFKSLTKEITLPIQNEDTYTVAAYIIDKFGRASSAITSASFYSDTLTISGLRSAAMYTDSQSTNPAILAGYKDNTLTGAAVVAHNNTSAGSRWTEMERELEDRYRSITLAVSGAMRFFIRTSDDNVNFRYFGGPYTGTYGNTLTEYASSATAQTNYATYSGAIQRLDFPSIIESRFIRIYHWTPSATYGMQEFYPRRLVQSDDIEAESIKSINIAAANVTADKIFVLNLAAVNAYTGNLTISGVLSIHTSGGIYQGTGSFASPTTGLKVYNTGGIGRLTTYSGGIVQVDIDTGGRLIAGAGNVQLSASGISIIGNDGSFLDQTSINWYHPTTKNRTLQIGGYTGSVSYATVQGTNDVNLGESQMLLRVTKTNPSTINTSFYMETNSGGKITATAARIDLNASGVGVQVTGSTGLNGTLDVTGLSTLQDTTIASDSIEINANGTGNRTALIDFHGDDTYTDYALRIVRYNTGANGNSQIQHRGTGGLYISTQDAGAIIFQTNGSNTRLQISSAGAIGFFGGGGTTQQTVTGSRGGNAALASLLTALANYGLIVNSSTA